MLTTLFFCKSQEVPVPLRDDPAKVRALSVIRKDVTTSESGQFHVSGADARICASIAFLAEQVKKDMLAVCEQTDAWKTVVTFVLHGRVGDKVPPRSIVFEFGYDESVFKLVIHANLAQGVEEAKFRSAIISALLYEKALRGKTPSDVESGLLIRPWLVEGIAETLDWKSGKRDRRIYQKLFESGGVYEAEEMLAISQVQYDAYDAAMKSAFKTSAGALVMALLEQPNGKKAFSGFLSEAALFAGDISMQLTKHFPNLNLSNKSLEKWWALQMANLSRNSLQEVISIGDTERALADALQLQFLNEEGVSSSRDLASWSDYLALDEPARAHGVRHAQEKLMRLSYRCFPSYRHLLQEYQAILQSLVTKKSVAQIGEKIEALQQSRALMLQRSIRATDYLDWYEITQARTTTGAFDDYVKFKQRLANGLSRKEDHVSRYLDRAQKLYERKASPRPPSSRTP